MTLDVARIPNAELIGEIFAEIERAEAMYPGFPNDPVHGAAILAEEAGETLQAALDFVYGRSSTALTIRSEAIQTAAMALRLLFAYFGKTD